MRRIFSILLLSVLLLSFICVTSSLKAQEVKGIYEKHLTVKRKPVPFQYVRESDVVWSKVIWRRLDLTQKRNLPLYYPTVDMEDRKSLMQTIMWGIKNKSLTPFSTDEFTTQYTLNDIDERFGAGNDTTFDSDPETGELIPIITKNDANMGEVKEMLIKEMWFFDKQRSVMEGRIIGMCPIRVYHRDDDVEQLDTKYTILFWIYYPEARNIFASQAVYTPQNQSQEISFDDYLVQRRFEGYVFKESNVYDNRSIEEYTSGLDALLESEKIKDEIFSFEHDLWEF
ncbi:MAG: gliding motility protein GldN [Bacteroidia bacterium]|nr:MAG: gliding motility protein GldN [Bacteroidia bacterium]